MDGIVELLEDHRRVTRLVFARMAFLLCALLCVGFAQPAYAGQSNGVGRTTVVNSLSLIKDADLNFGDLISGTTAGTVIVDPQSIRQVNGGPVAAGGTVSAARFQGSGTGGQRIRVRAPTGSYILTESFSGAIMTLRDLTLEVDNADLLGRGNSGQYRITGAGPFTVRVGGTLDVGANQPSGTYLGTFDIDVNYF